MYILDNHMHLRPDGENVEAVKKFCKAGGTHIFLAHIPYRDIPITGEDGYRKAFDRTLAMGDRVRKETEAVVFISVGPYPVDLVHMVEHMPLESATKIMMKGMDLAASLVEESYLHYSPLSGCPLCGGSEFKEYGPTKYKTIKFGE